MEEGITRVEKEELRSASTLRFRIEVGGLARGRLLLLDRAREDGTAEDDWDRKEYVDTIMFGSSIGLVVDDWLTEARSSDSSCAEASSSSVGVVGLSDTSTKEAFAAFVLILRLFLL